MKKRRNTFLFKTKRKKLACKLKNSTLEVQTPEVGTRVTDFNRKLLGCEDDDNDCWNGDILLLQGRTLLEGNDSLAVEGTVGLRKKEDDDG